MRIPHSVLRQDIVIERFAGQGARGPTFEQPELVKASAQSIEDLRVDWKDEEILVRYMVIVRPEVGKVPLGSRVTIEGVEGEAFRVIKAIPSPDYHRPTHYELMLMSWGSQ